MSENGLHSIPPILILNFLRDNILKGLDKKLAKKFSRQFEKAISVEADLSTVYYIWAARLLKRIRVYALDDGKKAIDTVIRFLERDWNTKDSEWHKVSNAAGDASTTTTNDAAYAAVSAAEAVADAGASYAYANDTARSAAIISTDAADAARSAAAGVDGVAAAGAEIEKQRDDLLEILKEIENE